MITTPRDVIVHSLDQESGRPNVASEMRRASQDGPLKPLKVFLHEAEREYLEQALIRNGWNVRKTVEHLGIHHSGLYRKIEAYHIQNRDNLGDGLSDPSSVVR